MPVADVFDDLPEVVAGAEDPAHPELPEFGLILGRDDPAAMSFLTFRKWVRWAPERTDRPMTSASSSTAARTMDSGVCCRPR